MKAGNKLKGLALAVLGMIWIVFVYYYDALLGRETKFDTKAVFCFILGIITVINGARIYRRK